MVLIGYAFSETVTKLLNDRLNRSLASNDTLAFV